MRRHLVLCSLRTEVYCYSIEKKTGWYTIFRPEAGTWMVFVPLLRRRKKRGEGFTAEASTPHTSTTPNGILSQEVVAEHRRIALKFACESQGMQLPETTEQQEEAAWKELSRYIKDTEQFDFSSSDESGSSEED